MAGSASGTEQAVGRVVGALCAVTARDEDAQSAMLASWISQVLHHTDHRCLAGHACEVTTMPLTA